MVFDVTKTLIGGIKMLKKAKKIFIETMEAIKTKKFIMDNKDSPLVSKVCCGKEKVISHDEETGKEFVYREEELLITPIENTYQCTKCGSKGTIIEWYSKVHDCSFADSILYFNDYYNLNLLDDVDQSDMARLMELVKFYNDEYIRTLDTLYILL